MIITSVVLLAGALVLLIAGATQGNPTLLGVSLGAAAAGALSLFAGNASAKRAAMARGVPVEAVLAGRLRRAPAAVAPTTSEPPGPPPIDGYDDMPAEEVTRLVATGAMTDEHLSDMLVYEASHRRRREVLTAIMDAVGADGAAAAKERDVGPVRRRLRGGRQTALADDEVDDRVFARPEPGTTEVDEQAE
ncbi:MAG TPA: hypothetical protein VG476_02275 [Acidimicrobiales bacterium]|nr:hypothetical protein [Acidimicrobiales bacterium]